MRPAKLLLLLSPLLAPAIAEAQAVEASPAARLFMEAASRDPLQSFVAADTTDSIPRRIRPTHWKKGALIGGLAGGAAIALLFAVVCSAGAEAETDCSGMPIAGFLTGGVLGGIAGALVGGQFPKDEEPDAERPGD
jgi:hypothetical protein